MQNPAHLVQKHVEGACKFDLELVKMHSLYIHLVISTSFGPIIDSLFLFHNLHVHATFVIGSCLHALSLKMEQMFSYRVNHVCFF